MEMVDPGVIPRDDQGNPGRNPDGSFNIDIYTPYQYKDQYTEDEFNKDMNEFFNTDKDYFKDEKKDFHPQIENRGQKSVFNLRNVIIVGIVGYIGYNLFN